ncbi:hypothetical protein D3C86_1873860 [compost metagenome]
MVDRGIGRGFRATVASVENAVAVFVAIQGIADQAAGQDTERRPTRGPTATLDCAQTTTDQAADEAANWPGALIEGGSAIAVGRATGQQAAN